MNLRRFFHRIPADPAPAYSPLDRADGLRECRADGADHYAVTLPPEPGSLLNRREEREHTARMDDLMTPLDLLADYRAQVSQAWDEIARSQAAELLPEIEAHLSNGDQQ